MGNVVREVWQRSCKIILTCLKKILNFGIIYQVKTKQKRASASIIFISSTLLGQVLFLVYKGFGIFF